jgi:hypothetical protein
MFKRVKTYFTEPVAVYQNFFGTRYNASQSHVHFQKALTVLGHVFAIGVMLGVVGFLFYVSIRFLFL